MVDTQSYAARLDIEYPEQRERLSVLLRAIYVLPIAIILGLLVGGSSGTSGVDATEWQEIADALREVGVSEDVLDSVGEELGEEGGEHASGGGGMASGMFVALVLMLLFRQRYPRWWFDFSRELTRFGARVVAYAALLTDRYPSTEDQQSVHLELDYPDAARLNRWLPLVKWLLALPHYVVLVVLAVVAVLGSLVAWVVILVTGRHPRGIFDFVVGVLRWGLRVNAYAFLLITDEYPPFSLR